MQSDLIALRREEEGDSPAAEDRIFLSFGTCRGCASAQRKIRVRFGVREGGCPSSKRLRDDILTFLPFLQAMTLPHYDIMREGHGLEK